MRLVCLVGPVWGAVLFLSGCPNGDGVELSTGPDQVTGGTMEIQTSSSASPTGTDPSPGTTGQDPDVTGFVTTSTTDDVCPDRPAGGYKDCIHGVACDGSSATCISDDPTDPSFGACSLSCSGDCDCFATPAGSEAVSTCAAILAEGEKACVLDCSGGKSCPPDMHCEQGLGVCVFLGGTGDTSTGTGDTSTEASDTGDIPGTTGLNPGCGDGQVDVGESCDDGNKADDDACLSTCKTAKCGDGVVWGGVEECDDGNGKDDDACLSACVAAACGDMIVWAGNETCDDGNQVDGDGCETDCIVTPGSKVWLRTHAAAGGYVNHAVVDGQGDLIVVLGHVENYGAIWRVSNADGEAAMVKFLNYDPQKVAVAKNGDLLLTGWNNADMDAVLDDPAIIERRTSDGAPIWSQEYIGVKKGAHGNGIIETKAGDVVAVGWMNGQNDLDAWIHKYTSGGAVVWTKSHNGDANISRDSANGVTVDAQDNIIVVGEENYHNVWLAKYSPAGAMVWSRAYDTGMNGEENGEAVVVRPNGDIVVVGKSANDGSSVMWAGTYSAAGDLKWAKTYSSPTGAVLAVTADSSDDILYAGRESQYDLTVRKLDPAGTSLWVRHDDLEFVVGGGGYGIGIDAKGFILAAGRVPTVGKTMWAGKFAP